MTDYVDQMRYDEHADAAYIRFVKTGDDERLTTHQVKDSNILLDFDSTGDFVGIECLSASDVFPERLLDRADGYENFEPEKLSTDVIADDSEETE